MKVSLSINFQSEPLWPHDCSKLFVIEAMKLAIVTKALHLAFKSAKRFNIIIKANVSWSCSVNMLVRMENPEGNEGSRAHGM